MMRQRPDGPQATSILHYLPLFDDHPEAGRDEAETVGALAIFIHRDPEAAAAGALELHRVQVCRLRLGSPGHEVVALVERTIANIDANRRPCRYARSCAP